MAEGLTDPARLNGEALRRWYLRSPADVEREREAVAAGRYASFFGEDIQGERAADSPQLRFTPPRIGNAATFRTLAVAQNGARARTPPAAATCVSCHTAPALVPSFPFRPGMPSFREGVPSPSKPPERDRKQCEQQLQRDTDTCTQQPNNAAKAVCHGTASKRYAYCRTTGEVGEPDLFTIPRMPSRW